MSKTISGVKPTASITGTARQTGSARQQAGKTGEATTGRKPLTPAQRKRKQERDRAYRLRKNQKKVSPRLVRRDDLPKPTRGRGNLCGDVPCERCSEYDKCRTYSRTSGFPKLHGMTQAEMDRRDKVRQDGQREAATVAPASRAAQVPGCVCGSSAEAASNARKWLTATWTTLSPGECRAKTFTGGGRRIRVEVGCDRPADAAPRFAPPAAVTVFDRIARALLDGPFQTPIRCGMDFAEGPMQVVWRLVSPAQALRWQIASDVRALVNARRGWMRDPAAWEEMA